MKLKIRVRRRAEAELFLAQDWYDDQQEGLGSRFREAVDLTLDRAAERPLIYAVVHQDIRRALVPRFPYILYFVVRRPNLIVLACLNASEDPAKIPRSA